MTPTLRAINDMDGGRDAVHQPRRRICFHNFIQPLPKNNSAESVSAMRQEGLDFEHRSKARVGALQACPTQMLFTEVTSSRIECISTENEESCVNASFLNSNNIIGEQYSSYW
jgi:hypothetical protein